MTIDQQVADHYARDGLEDAIFEALRASGRDPERLAPADLAAVDEFHLGWRAQTVEFAKTLGLEPGMRLLDVGAGIGGPARYFAEAYGCDVVGVDLSADYVRCANALTRRCGLADRVVFKEASALSLPFEDGSFDVATLIHVGMNIPDKKRLFSDMRRVLRPDAPLGVYDVMRTGDGDLAYPVPWARSADTSFVERPESYRRLLREAGFEIAAERDRRAFSLALWHQMRERVAKEGTPPLGLHILMGSEAPRRLANALGAIERGVLAPIEMVARAM